MVKIIDDIIVVFLMEFSYKDENLEDEFKNLLDKLNKVYNIDIKGSYKINLYKEVEATIKIKLEKYFKI